MQQKSRTITAAAIADHSTRAALTTYADGETSDNGIKVPGAAGLMFTLVAIEIVLKSTLTTVVNAGGLFEFENNSIDWKPLEIYPNLTTAAGANAGAAMSPTRIPVNVPLPAGSIVSVYYTALNAATDRPYVTLVWEERGFGGKQTFSDAAVGSALTQVTKASSHITITIPVKKGGKLLGIVTQVHGTIETIVVGGGFVNVRGNGITPAVEPWQWETGGLTTIGTGGGEQKLEMHYNDVELGGGCSVIFDYTPVDNQSQALAVMVIWEA